MRVRSVNDFRGLCEYQPCFSLTSTLPSSHLGFVYLYAYAIALSRIVCLSRHFIELLSHQGCSKEASRHEYVIFEGVMDQTPTRASRFRDAEVNVLEQENEAQQQSASNGRIRKPPPITPRRFNKFFAPRPRDARQSVRTSRAALKSISSTALNTRRNQLSQEGAEGFDEYISANENAVSRKKRKYSTISASVSSNSTPYSRAVNFLPSSQDALPSSPLKGRDDDDDDEILEDSDAETEIDEQSFSYEEDELPAGPRAQPYARISTSHSLLSTRVSGRRPIRIAGPSNLWQAETANFYSEAADVNEELHTREPPTLPFCMASCNTNPLIATGDEEGFVRFIDPSDNADFDKTILELQPHDNALMDIAFSSDDNFIATASGDQTCQIIDVQAKQSLYSLRAHTASVKKIAFQPGTGDKILASAGRDGTICLWDTRVRGQSMGQCRKARAQLTPMSEDMTVLAPVLEIFGAHNPNVKSKTSVQKPKHGSLTGRHEFSITSLSFLDASRSNLLATSSEVDTVIKLWDLRQSQVSARKKGHSQLPVSVTDEPRSHALHRKFGINSIALSTDASRLYALSRDHTVYAYSTSHLILGCTPEIMPSTPASRKLLAPMRMSSNTGLGPLYGLRHPNLRVATFWPRIVVRQCTETNTELLAVGSTDDCAILFPTNEKYHTRSTRAIPTLHDPLQQNLSVTASPRRSGRISGRPGMTRAPTTSFTTLFTKSRQEEDALALPIYYHGTPLIHGHTKEVTALAWSSEGNLVTASDDFTVRCWRENAKSARTLRGHNKKGQRDDASLISCGWADVGVPEWDDED